MDWTFGKLILRVLAALVIGALAGLLFQSVLPGREAEALAVVVAVVDLVGSFMSGRGGFGLKMLWRLGGVVLTWGAAGWVLTLIGFADRGVRMGLAAAIASAVGMLAARHGQGRETQRLVSVMIACAIPVYVILHAVAGSDPRAIMAACVACAVAPVTALVAHTWPDAHHSRLLAASGLCVAAALVVFAVRVPF